MALPESGATSLHRRQPGSFGAFESHIFRYVAVIKSEQHFIRAPVRIFVIIGKRCQNEMFPLDNLCHNALMPDSTPHRVSIGS